MNLPTEGLPFVLLQWTVLLSLGWGIHGMVRHLHPRWRIILWRSILTISCALPLVDFLALPKFAIVLSNVAPTVRSTESSGGEIAPGSSTISLPPTIAPRVSTPPGKIVAPAVIPAPTAATGQKPESSGTPFPWWPLISTIWCVGCGWETIRLLRLQIQLRRTARRATVANSAILTLASQIERELNLRRAVRVRMSDGIASPLLCGVFVPTILIPRRFADDLTADEIAALLSHEMAHQSRHDLGWCIGWRLLKAVGWFHPLGWGVPEAHVLACEEEADRTAAERVWEGAGYAQLLARISLRVIGVPLAESCLTLSATSHLSRRLMRLGRDRGTPFRWGHSTVGLLIALGLLVATAGWQFGHSEGKVTRASIIPTNVVLVIVQNERGGPIAGATITPDGLRGRGDEGSHYGWRPVVHGPVVKAVTDEDGKAYVRYPVAVLPEEKLLTSEISFSVEHPEYASQRPTEFPVDGSAKPIQLKRGIQIRVAGFFGPKHEPVAEIVPNLMGDDEEEREVRPEDWTRSGDGSLVWSQMSAEKHTLFLAGRLPSGERVYSEPVTFFGEQRNSHNYVLELRPGTRLEGRIDSKVPRPVKNAWVQVSVHGEPSGLETGYWMSYRPIAADGSFVVESLPLGELKITAYGDGFISANGLDQPIPVRFPGGSFLPPRRSDLGIPQSFNASAPVTKVELVTEATATVKVVAKSGGKAIAGAKVWASPNVIDMTDRSGLFGTVYGSSEEAFQKIDPPPKRDRDYTATTDRAGVAILRNIPAFTRRLVITDPRFEVPLQTVNEPDVPPQFRSRARREIKVTLAPGKTAEIEVVLQLKGREFEGESR